MRKVPILPSLFTSGSLFCGMLAIFEVYHGNLSQACWYIVISGVLDVMDGAVARVTRTTSPFGLYFDSLTDVVAFGVAPAMMVYEALAAAYPKLAGAVCSLYVVCGALRLARFNVQANREERKAFLGLPIPGAGMGVVAVIWLFERYPGVGSSVAFERVAPPVMVALAYLMVSKVPFPGVKHLHLMRRQPFEILVTIVVVVCLLFMLKDHLVIVGTVVVWFYTTAPPLYRLLHPLERRRRRAAAELRESAASIEPRE